jgi:glycosyltransferase involved in cell wall biosynthesis
MVDKLSLTVIVLTYNCATTIGACLDSLVEQDHQDFEVLIVDDDSTDETMSILSEYDSLLRLTVLKNGSHVIPRGRNIGIANSQTDLVAFVDSDDSVARDWTRVIVETFDEDPEVALLSGYLVPAHRSSAAHAISLNDAAIRDLFGKNEMLFCAGNCAMNRKILTDVYFDEDFGAGEDLELWSRITKQYRWIHVPAMKVYRYSRETFSQYAKQMYRYGLMKQYFGFVTRRYRWLDFIPLSLLVVGILGSLLLQSWWSLLLLLVLPFSLLEALFVIIYQRCPARIAPLTFVAWIVKNLSWSCGIGRGLVALAVDSDTREFWRAKRTGGR